MKSYGFTRRVVKLTILGLLVFSLLGCQQTNNPANGNTATNGNSANSNTTVIKSDSTATNSNTVSPNSESAGIEQKANAIVGKWATTTAMDDKIAFDFSPSKKEGETYVGTYTFYVNDTKDAPAKYVVSGDKMIKFFDKEGKEYPLIKVSVSDDGKSLSYTDQKGGLSKLTKVTDSTKQTETAEIKEDCKVKKDNAIFLVTTTEKTIKLKKGTSISWTIPDMHQGIIVVKAKVGNKWVQGEIKLDYTTCNE